MEPKGEKDYYTETDLDNNNSVVCLTRFKKDGILHRVHFRMPKVNTDEEAHSRYGTSISGLVALGIRQLSYLIGSRDIFLDPRAWTDDGNLAQSAVDAVQHSADTIKVTPKTKKPRSTEAEIRQKAISDLAQQFNMTVEEVNDFLAAKAKEKDGQKNKKGQKKEQGKKQHEQENEQEQEQE